MLQERCAERPLLKKTEVQIDEDGLTYIHCEFLRGSKRNYLSEPMASQLPYGAI